MAAVAVHDSQQPRMTVGVTASATAAVTSIDFHQVQQQYQHHQHQHQQQQQKRPLEKLACRFEALISSESAEARSRPRGEAVSGTDDDAEDSFPAERAQEARAEWTSASERASPAPVSAGPRAWRVGGSCGNLASEFRSGESDDSGGGASSASGSGSGGEDSAPCDGESSASCGEVSRSLRVREFADACDGIGQLFSVLGPAFAFAGKEFFDKVADLHVAGREFGTLAEMMAEDQRRGVARVKGSHTRNLLRVVRGLDLNRRIFALLLQDSSQPLRVYAGQAYSEVFSAVHPWPVRSLVAAGLFTLPSTPAFLLLLGESDTAWQQRAQRFVAALSPVIQAVDHLFLSQGLGLDW
ncbi:hypothetical protein CLOM_g21389 [Closterium sp. NIES-68]|nr:hypothetical protein CLOM_g21389 [Closterium sp. NIES-68]GJP84331.1 hypothetical protein CLOP_g14398 [Closterium sp. NIES-67]